MKIFGREIFSCLAGLSLVLGMANTAAAGPLFLDIRLDTISLEPDNNKIEEGGSVKIRCKWSVDGAGKTKWTKSWGEGVIAAQQTFPAPGYTVIKKATNIVPAGTYGTAGDEFGLAYPKGEFEGTWQAQKPGLYTLRCDVFPAGLVYANSYGKEVGPGVENNNSQFVYVSVTKKPTKSLKSPSARHCEPKMDAWVELDTSGLNAADVNPAEKKKVTLPLLSSSAFLDTVQCAYGDQKVNAMYLIKCKKAKKYTDDPNWYHCEKQ